MTATTAIGSSGVRRVRRVEVRDLLDQEHHEHGDRQRTEQSADAANVGGPSSRSPCQVVDDRRRGEGHEQPGVPVQPRDGPGRVGQRPGEGGESCRAEHQRRRSQEAGSQQDEPGRGQPQAKNGQRAQQAVGEFRFPHSGPNGHCQHRGRDDGLGKNHPLAGLARRPLR